MKPRRIEDIAYACGLAAAGLSVAFLYLIKWGPESFVAWWTQTPAVTS